MENRKCSRVQGKLPVKKQSREQFLKNRILDNYKSMAELLCCAVGLGEMQQGISEKRGSLIPFLLAELSNIAHFDAIH